MSAVRWLLNSAIFAWWDGVMTISRIVLTLAGIGADYALEQMQAANLRQDIDAFEWHPDAIPHALEVRRQQAEAHETLRKVVIKLNELDTLSERIKHVGRRQR